MRIRAVWSAPLLLYNISSFYIPNFKPLTSFSVAAQAGLSLTWYNNNNNFFQEDNMFGTNAKHVWHECQSSIWSSDTKTYMRLIITDRTKIIYSMYREGEVSVHRACCERTTQPYSLGGGGTIFPGYWPADVTTRSPRMVAECLLARC